MCKNSNDLIHIHYYKKYSRILADLINLAEKESAITSFWLIQLTIQNLVGESLIIILIEYLE